MNRVKFGLGALALILSAPLDAKAVKIIAPLPRALLGAEQVTAVEVTVGEAARETFAALEKKAADKKAHANKGAAADPTQPIDPVATLPFAEMLSIVIRDEARDWGIKGARPIKLAFQLDTLKTADAGVAILLGSNDELAGIVTVLDANDGQRLGEFYVDVLNSRSGLLGLAMRGSGVREKLAREFATHVATVLSGRKSKTAKTITEPTPALATGQTKLIPYPIAADIMAKTPAEIGMPISPMPPRGSDDIALSIAPAADHEVIRASMMEGGASLTNRVSALMREVATARDRDGQIGNGLEAPSALTIGIDSATTLTRCVTTAELKGTCIVRITMSGTAKRTNESAPRAIALTLDQSIAGLKISNSVALVSREAALEFLRRAEQP